MQESHLAQENGAAKRLYAERQHHLIFLGGADNKNE